LAFAALIDSRAVKRNRDKDINEEGFLQPIHMTEEETSRVFLGALMVLGM